uniref:Uncharacterized protein n=1 Tax=Rhizophagus irregularis (strain DAOM 181602 / DAOM 197198 / MUCL 43194) TaxID=747089 RepID=U9U6Z0_RHIID
MAYLILEEIKVKLKTNKSYDAKKQKTKRNIQRINKKVDVIEINSDQENEDQETVSLPVCDIEPRES